MKFHIPLSNVHLFIPINWKFNAKLSTFFSYFVFYNIIIAKAVYFRKSVTSGRCTKFDLIKKNKRLGVASNSIISLPTFCENRSCDVKKTKMTKHKKICNEICDKAHTYVEIG
jgi:hypothetical protein